MQKFLFCLFVSFISILPVFSAETNEKLYTNCLKPTVLFTTRDKKYVGSGVLVRSDLVNSKYHNVVITCNHCARHSPYNLVQVPKYNSKQELTGYTNYNATVYARVKNYDLAIILFESDVVLPVAQLEMNPKLVIGSKILRVGYGLGDDPRLDRGEITSVKTLDPDFFRGYYRTNVYTVYGDSGGPLFNKKYNVIGIAHGIRCASGHDLFQQSYYIPTQWLKTWDDEINNTVSFVYNKDAKMPVMSFFFMKMEDIKPQKIGAKKK